MVNVYAIYYVWDGKRDEHPWWIVLPRPRREGDLEWVVVETAAIEDVHDTEAFMKAIQDASPLGENWIENYCYQVQRTRWERLQGVLFGTDPLPSERQALEEVARRIAECDRPTRNR